MWLWVVCAAGARVGRRGWLAVRCLGRSGVRGVGHGWQAVGSCGSAGRGASKGGVDRDVHVEGDAEVLHEEGPEGHRDKDSECDRVIETLQGSRQVSCRLAGRMDSLQPRMGGVAADRVDSLREPSGAALANPSSPLRRHGVRLCIAAIGLARLVRPPGVLAAYGPVGRWEPLRVCVGVNSSCGIDVTRVAEEDAFAVGERRAGHAVEA